MFKDKINLDLKENTKALIVSDIHLQLPLTRELEMIQGSLVSRINELSKSRNAILILNGDILELWENKDQTVADILDGFSKLTQAINNFIKIKSHKVIYVVGNHDDIISRSSSEQKSLHKLWGAEICRTLDTSIGKDKIRIEHGHESDSYNATSNQQEPKGKKLVQNILPFLLKTMPSLFKGIGDVVNRSLLPSYVLSNLAYKTVAPICIPIVLIISMFLSIGLSDDRYWKAAVLVFVLLWAVFLITDVLLRFVASFALGGGSTYMKKVDKYQKEAKFETIIYGHTHQGLIEKRNKYTYANSGCNDVVAFPKIGWMGLVRFNRYVQLSNLSIDNSKKDYLKYHQEIVPLVE